MKHAVIFLLVGSSACARALPPTTTSPSSTVAAPPAPVASEARPRAATCDISKFSDLLSSNNQTTGPEFLLSKPIRSKWSDSLYEGVEIIGGSCSGPLHDVHDKMYDLMGMSSKQHPVNHPTSASLTYFPAMLESIKKIVDPACIFDADRCADENPNFAQCPMPAELVRTMPSGAIGRTHAGLYAFVSAYAAIDSSLYGRLMQLKLLYADYDNVEMSCAARAD